jgi:hypothetical protein
MNPADEDDRNGSPRMDATRRGTDWGEMSHKVFQSIKKRVWTQLNYSYSAMKITKIINIKRNVKNVIREIAINSIGFSFTSITRDK